MNYVCLLSAIFFICLAHMIRVLRWEMFINIYEKPDRRNLIQALSIGYFLSYIFPFKLGDIARAWISGKKMKTGSTLGFSTVIVERYLDVICVGIIFMLLVAGGIGGEDIRGTTFFYIAMTMLLLALMLTIFAFRGAVKRMVMVFASIFNERIETAMLEFSWALIWNFKNIFQKINGLKLALATTGMWAAYIVSYTLFAQLSYFSGNEATWKDVFILLFEQGGIKQSASMVMLSGGNNLGINLIFIILYFIVPLFLLIAISMVMKKDTSMHDEDYLKLMPHLDPRERLAFLENYFSDINREYIKNYITNNSDISIIRDLSAGSNARTMLCMKGNRTFFRKYAYGTDGEKLYQQIRWLEENKGVLALPEITNQEKTSVYCFYDMSYIPNAVGMFEYAHSMPLERTWEVLRKALASLEQTIYQVNVRKADKETVASYISVKVQKNLEKIKEEKRIRNLQRYETIVINGTEYRNLGFYEEYFSMDYLEKVFLNDDYAVIHGDLTIENIICTRDEKGNDGFYLIDPNTGNIHDSPNLDYGKMLQSIHGGYEFLMAAKDVKVNENRIDFLFPRSSKYMELHVRLKQYMENNFDRGRIRSIYFHEIIHWLRLMPYKIEKDDRRAMIFYAGMLMVMNDVIEMYGKEG